MGITLLAASLQPTSSQPAFIPLSDVIDIARVVARDEGFAVEDRNQFYVDTLDSNSRKRLDGFVSVAVYQSDQAQRLRANRIC